MLLAGNPTLNELTKVDAQVQGSNFPVSPADNTGDRQNPSAAGRMQQQSVLRPEEGGER